MSDKQPITLAVTIKRKVGHDEIEWRAAANAYPADSDGVFDLLNSAVNNASNDWLTNYSASRRPSGDSTVLDDSGAAWFAVERVAVIRDNGKRYIKLFCGRWSNYGVIVWPEVLERAGIQPDNIPDAGITPDGWKACIVSENGARPRCINVTHAADKRGMLA